LLTGLASKVSERPLVAVTVIAAAASRGVSARFETPSSTP
jgi:hypothetical protein